MIPVSVLTGFLGSGKTTLLSALLRHSEMERTAVIVNEFGEIGIDHDLIETSDESFIQLSNGCLCCNVRSDLVRTLLDLFARRREGSVPPFERVVVETSGLADPAPILHALLTDRAVRAHYSIAGIIATVDALTGSDVLTRYRESVRQIALADCAVVTKTDLPQARPDAVAQAIGSIQPDCPILYAVRGSISPSELFAFPRTSLSEHDLQRYRHHEGSTSVLEHRHSSGIGSVSIVREEPVHAATLALFISALAENCGPDVIRMKGIVSVAEMPDSPAVIHGVQHVYHAPRWLSHWPSSDRRTRIVCIGYGLSARWIRGTLDVLEDEVAEETARRSTGAVAARREPRSRPS